MTFVIPFPNIDPVLIQFGPLAIRWYGLAYVVGLILGWQYVRRLAKGPPRVALERDVDDFLVWATLGVVLGGRIGYVLFYQPAYYLAHPLAVFQVWEGGMSFHGGLLGVITATVIFVRRRHIPLLAFGDTLACATPIGLFFGRIANFINGELFGRFTDVPWAMIFPRGAVPASQVPSKYLALCQPVMLVNGPGLNCPRHPSEIYEALMEGALLLVVLHLLWRSETIRRRPGTLIGAFLVGYGVARIIGEMFRQPDIQIGYLIGGTTMGQWLSAPMVIAGLVLIVWAKRRA